MSIVAASVANTMIEHWRLVRLTAEADSIGFPTVNVLEQQIRGTGQMYIPPAQILSDAEHIQRIVGNLSDELKSAFEAYHLALIRDERCKGTPHKARALILGISASTYHKRVNYCFQVVQKKLFQVFEPSE